MSNKEGGYGTIPKCLGHFDLKFPEMMFYLYLPIKLAGVRGLYPMDIPNNLSFLTPLLEEVDAEPDDYVYITAKNMWFEEGQTYNRPGWHSDGFMTDDINYIWSDGKSTEFMFTSMELTQDHDISMKEMQKQYNPNYHCTVPRKELIKLDQYVIHQPPEVTKSGMRGFIKISVSKDKYNLKGNSHNHLLDYSWDMVDRVVTRNDPANKEK